MPTASGTETGLDGPLEAPASAADGVAETMGTGRDGFHPFGQLERRTQEIGRELFDRIGRGPRPWQRGWWDDRVVAATLDDPLVRVQLFRFIDVLPALEDPGRGPPASLRVSIGSQ